MKSSAKDIFKEKFTDFDHSLLIARESNFQWLAIAVINEHTTKLIGSDLISSVDYTDGSDTVRVSSKQSDKFRPAFNLKLRQLRTLLQTGIIVINNKEGKLKITNPISITNSKVELIKQLGKDKFTSIVKNAKANGFEWIATGIMSSSNRSYILTGNLPTKGETINFHSYLDSRDCFVSTTGKLAKEDIECLLNVGICPTEAGNVIINFHKL